MQPNAPQPPGHNPYEFITNPSQPPKKPVLGGGSSTMSRVMIASGGVLALIIIATIVISLFSSAGKGSTDTLKALVAQQQELVRVADLGVKSAKDSSTRSLAITAKLSASTQQQELIGYLESNGVKLSKEELAGKANAAVDEELESATSINRFDDTFNEIIAASLTEYAQQLQTAYDATSNEAGKALLSNSYDSTANLLGPPTATTGE